MTPAVYSVRMRAAKGGPHEEGGRHISGAERIVPEERIAETIQQMLHRAKSHALGKPDFINFNVERLEPRRIKFITALPLQTVRAENHEQAVLCARELLLASGVQPVAIQGALQLVARGPAPGGQNMRGAVIMDAMNGKRLEPDPWRGVRASRIDYTPHAQETLSRLLQSLGLDHYRVKEALALATKVLYAGTLAEICCSDDPNYTTGYVSSRRFGYIRIPHFKRDDLFKGGRVFFVHSQEIDLEDYITRLEEEPVLIEKIASVERMRELSAILNSHSLLPRSFEQCSRTTLPPAR